VTIVSGLAVAPTFDDGPDPPGTPAVQDALAEAEVRATFLVLGERIETRPEIVVRAIDAGHAVICTVICGTRT
jgi:peptidoglycan/xylan/chitin deacetylase (PgdA/CDA1 family)